MSGLQQFNRAVAHSQLSRQDVQEIVRFVRTRAHPCPLLLHGYCRDCPAYIVFRNATYRIVTQASIDFDYAAEHARADIVAREMLSPLRHVPRPASPPLRRTHLAHIRPPTNMSQHTCAVCTREHTSDHTCPPCTQAHLSEHTCPPNVLTPENLPPPQTNTDTQTSVTNPPMANALWQEIQATIRRAVTAPSGTPLDRLRRAISHERLSADQVIAALRPVTTTVTTTTIQHVLKQVPVAPDSSVPLPLPPSSVSMDPVVANTTLGVASRLLDRIEEGQNLTSTMYCPTPHGVTQITNALGNHQVNYSPGTASTNLLYFLRWSAAMHRQEELQALPHTHFCMYHPCPISNIYRYIRACRIGQYSPIDGKHFLNVLTSGYITHLQEHSYPESFKTEVLDDVNIGNNTVSLDDLSPVVTVPMRSLQQRDVRTRNCSIQRFSFDYEDGDVSSLETATVRIEHWPRTPRS